MERKNIAEEIKRYRHQNNMSVPDLSKQTGIPQERIYKWEKGTVPYVNADYEKMTNLINGKFVKMESVDRAEDLEEKNENLTMLIKLNSVLGDTNKDLTAEVIDGAKSMRSFVGDQNRLIEKVLSIKVVSKADKVDNPNYPSKRHSVSYLLLHLHQIADVLSHKFVLDRENVLLVLGSILTEIHLQKQKPDTQSA